MIILIISLVISIPILILIISIIYKKNKTKKINELESYVVSIPRHIQYIEYSDTDSNKSYMVDDSESYLSNNNSYNSNISIITKSLRSPIEEIDLSFIYSDDNKSLTMTQIESLSKEGFNNKYY
jgi:hypothetical protein